MDVYVNSTAVLSSQRKFEWKCLIEGNFEDNLYWSA